MDFSEDLSSGDFLLPSDVESVTESVVGLIVSVAVAVGLDSTVAVGGFCDEAGRVMAAGG